MSSSFFTNTSSVLSSHFFSFAYVRILHQPYALGPDKEELCQGPCLLCHTVSCRERKKHRCYTLRKWGWKNETLLFWTTAFLCCWFPVSSPVRLMLCHEEKNEKILVVSWNSLVGWLLPKYSNQSVCSGSPGMFQTGYRDRKFFSQEGHQVQLNLFTWSKATKAAATE